MAVLTDGWFSNAMVSPQGGGDFSIYEQHSTPRYAVGTRIMRQDGNEYAYAHFGADTATALLVAQDMSESGEPETDNIVVAPASAQTTTDGTINNKFIEITLASVTADQYAGGYLNITDGTGIGHSYRIKGNTATGNPASGNFRMELNEGLVLALDATSDISITGNPFANLEVATAATDIVISGVTIKAITVATNAYGWVQTRGVCVITVDATDLELGDNCALSADVAGNIYTVADAVTGAQIVADEEFVGVALDTPDDNSVCPVKLKIW